MKNLLRKLAICVCFTPIAFSSSAVADPNIDTHTQICVDEGGDQVECLCTATAIKNIGSGDEQYARAVVAAQNLGHAAAMQLYQQVMANNPDHQAAYDAEYQACLDTQNSQ